MKYLTIALFLISLAGCSDNNTESGIRLKNGYYDGYFLYDTLYLWESFRVKADTFVELASGGVRYQKNHIPWKVSTPEEQGMSSLTFINGLDHLMQDRTNIHSLLVIRNVDLQIQDRTNYREALLKGSIVE
jgi:hypothetical protein